MSPTVKQFLALGGSFLIFVVAWYGNYLPLHKSQDFIEATRNIANARSLDQFTKTMDVPLTDMSPIGQEELVRNMASVVTNVLRSPSGKDARLTAAVMDYMTKYFDPIIRRGRGMSFEQDVYVMGLANQISFLQTQDPKYYQAALEYYLLGNRLGPARPQTLYGLFDIYRLGNQPDKAIEVANRILTLWPGDQAMKTALDELKKAKAAAPKKK
jgi:hypothetical protein